MIASLKALHIATLVIWCAGLIALPVMMQAYGRSRAATTEAGFGTFRLLSHGAYTRLVTPAAVVAIAAGTALIFAVPVTADWLLVKLAAVSGMVLLHAWLGHLIARTGEERGRYRLPSPLWALAGALPLMALVLWLVLAKPDLAALVEQLPSWMRQPLGRELPPELTPI